jgi:hopene-associated glycosyltransferase HpnB
MLAPALAALTVTIWLSLLFLRGSFWRVSKNLPRQPAGPIPPRKIVAVIPARNEAAVIGIALTSLFEQHLPHPLAIVLVDDGSTDGTVEVAQAAAQAAGESSLIVIEAGPVPAGWTGKLWAMARGVARAAELQPDYLLLTDADIRHRAGSVAALLTIAEFGNFQLVSYMVKLACCSLAERALIPAFVFFFFLLYPPQWIAARHRRTAGAAGGCMLIRADMLRRIGGMEAIRSQVIDDCALARAVKRNRGRVFLSLTDTAESIRPYNSFAEIGSMISRTAFYQLRHSALLLILTITGLCLTYCLPVALLFSGNKTGAILGAIAWLMMAIAYLPMVRFYRLSPLWSFALPAISLFYAGATIHSAFAYWLGFGGRWKGRVQDARTSG